MGSGLHVYWKFVADFYGPQLTFNVIKAVCRKVQWAATDSRQACHDNNLLDRFYVRGMSDRRAIWKFFIWAIYDLWLPVEFYRGINVRQPKKPFRGMPETLWRGWVPNTVWGSARGIRW